MNRSARSKLTDDRRRVVGRGMIDDDQFPGARWKIESREMREELWKTLAAIPGTDDQRDPRAQRRVRSRHARTRGWK